jgi:hypothetical protein
MPWQQYVADVVMEIDPTTGRFVYDEVGLEVPRQSGKSTFVLAKAVHRSSATGFFGPRQNLVYTAQTRKDARLKWEEDYVEELRASRTWKSRVDIHLGNGNEHIRFPNRSRFGIESTTEKAGHGGTIDEWYSDEAFALQDSRLEQAARPAMITRANKLFVWLSTAGWLDASPYLWDKTQIGRAQVDAGLNEGLAYFEWSAPQEANPYDRDVWRACMPALGYTITEEAIEKELRASERKNNNLADFRRAYLNQWVPKPVAELAALPGWELLSDPRSSIVGRPVFALDMTPDQSRTSIAASGLRSDGKTHVEIVENGDGTAWVVPRCVRLVAKQGGAVVVDPAGPAGSLIADLEAAGVPVEKTTARDLAHACGSLYLAVTTGDVKHQNDPRLNDAVKAARKRKLGDAWAFDRNSEGDSSPLLAVTLARHGVMTGPGPSVYTKRDLIVL